MIEMVFFCRTLEAVLEKNRKQPDACYYMAKVNLMVQSHT